MRSQLESELVRILNGLRSYVAGRDRFVLIGLALSLLPVFPACLIGAIISVANVYLGRSGRLSLDEIRLSRLGTLVGLSLTIGWIFIFYFFSPFSDIGAALDFVSSFIKSLLRSVLPDNGITTQISSEDV
jgi:hypothetical protein